MRNLLVLILILQSCNHLLESNRLTWTFYALNVDAYFEIEENKHYFYNSKIEKFKIYNEDNTICTYVGFKFQQLDNWSEESMITGIPVKDIICTKNDSIQKIQEQGGHSTLLGDYDKIIKDSEIKLIEKIKSGEVKNKWLINYYNNYVKN